jgi:hypothetical protein
MSNLNEKINHMTNIFMQKKIQKTNENNTPYLSQHEIVIITCELIIIKYFYKIDKVIFHKLILQKKYATEEKKKTQSEKKIQKN